MSSSRGQASSSSRANLSFIATNAQVPFLPGNTLNFNLPNQRFSRGSTLSYTNGFSIDRKDPIIANKRDSGTTRRSLKPGWSNSSGMRAWTAPLSFIDSSTTSRMTQTQRNLISYLDRPPKMPNYVVLDKIILRFRAWFKDEMSLLTGPDRLIVHNCILLYYLLDDSFMIMEPRQENSGLNQGCIMRRQQVAKQDGSENYSWKDLFIGAEITMRAKQIHLIDCDEFTRSWYLEQGIEMDAPQQAPEDPYEIREMAESKKRRDYEMAKQRRIQKELMQVEEVKHRFLTYDRQVLRFYAIWDDRYNLFGLRHFLAVRFYLSDFTIDIQEFEGSANGRKSRFLARQRVPREPTNLDAMKSLKIEDCLAVNDLFVGAKVNILGKDILIYDCDKFTRDFYQEQFGEVMNSIDISEQSVPMPRLPTPPSNGIGAEEDSMQNCKMLRPKPLHKDMAKYKKYAGKVLRFEAKWVSDRPEEKVRTFIISFYLADDTISIWETSGDGRNTGMFSGKFLERMKLKKPGTFGTKMKYYSKSDFYVGAVIEAQTRKFELVSMDKFTERLMDTDDQAAAAMLQKEPVSLRFLRRVTEHELQEFREQCIEADKDKEGVISLEDFMEIISSKLTGFSENDIMDLRCVILPKGLQRARELQQIL
eukprot:759911-Hanusia_phi.AAC.12